MFVHDPLRRAPTGEDASRAAHDVANELRRLLALPGHRPGARRRRRPAARGQAGPAGAHAGLLRRPTTPSGRRSGRRRRCCAPHAIVGRPRPVRPVHRAGRPAAVPRSTGISADDVREIRRIKARVDDERLPRGADPTTHLKLGRGGLADVEWTVQLLQMQHAGRSTGLRTTRTLDALRGGRRRGPARPARRRGAHRGLADRQRAAQRDHCRCAGRRVGLAAARHPGAGRGGAHPRLRAGGVRRAGQRLPAGDPPGPAGRGAGLLGVAGASMCLQVGVRARPGCRRVPPGTGRVVPFRQRLLVQTIWLTARPGGSHGKAGRSRGRARIGRHG